MKLLALAAVLAAAACGNRDADPDAPDQPPAPTPIGDTGAVVDAPANWKVSPDGKISYRVGRGPGRQVFLTEMVFAVKSVDEYYRDECAKYAIAPGIKETTPHGAFYIQCRTSGSDRAGKPIELTSVRSIVRVGDKAMRCRFETPGDPAQLIAVCRSLRARR